MGNGSFALSCSCRSDSCVTNCSFDMAGDSCMSDRPLDRVVGWGIPLVLLALAGVFLFSPVQLDDPIPETGTGRSSEPRGEPDSRCHA